ncbi:MAG: hypothetical protein M1833_007056 [Piccolia ochrophora]|nr:MAG: hypothetical protein M1833_007056 [Piccolia ochrophora]
MTHFWFTESAPQISKATEGSHGIFRRNLIPRHKAKAPANDCELFTEDSTEAERTRGETRASEDLVAALKGTPRYQKSFKQVSDDAALSRIHDNDPPLLHHHREEVFHYFAGFNTTEEQLTIPSDDVRSDSAATSAIDQGASVHV